jgi:sugar phosphate isomerase/epimerase
MRRALGVCTWTFGPCPLAEIAATVSRLGFNGVELLGDLNALQPGQVGSVLAEHNLDVFSLTPANDIGSLPVDPSHPDAAIRREMGDVVDSVDFSLLHSCDRFRNLRRGDPELPHLSWPRWSHTPARTGWSLPGLFH